MFDQKIYVHNLKGCIFLQLIGGVSCNDRYVSIASTFELSTDSSKGEDREIMENGK